MSLTLTAAAIVQLIDWKGLFKHLSDDAAKEGAKQLLKHLKRDHRENAARQAIELFIEEWLLELEDKTPLGAAVPGYKDQLKRLIELAGPEIVQWMDPEKKEVNLGPVQRVWSANFDPLPEDFSWELVAQNYGRAIRKYLKSDAELRAMLSAANEERIAEAAERAAGPEVGFDLPGYREFLKKKCSTMQLAVMHSSAYQYDRKITLWSVFVPQLARESAPVLEIPAEIELRLREQGHLVHKRDENKIAELRQRQQTSAVSPVLKIVERERLVVVLGNPGSGKSSLLKYLALRWAHKNEGRLPLLIDLREYVNDRGRGIPEYFESGCAAFRLDAREIDKQLKDGEAVLLFDGLDEIFDNATRGSMVDEAIALASRYPQAQIVLTSRSFGYEPEKLQNNGFVHATIEDFNDDQVREFLRLWHEIAEDDTKEQKRLQKRIERAIGESRAIRELAGNPLLLTMMAILNRNQELPRDRVELYREASRVLLGEWDASRALPVDAFARQEKEALLRALAGDMQQSKGGLAGNLIDRASLIQRFRSFLAELGIQDSYQKASLLVQQLTERNFILAYVGADHFSFVHRTFLEFYCAAWFVDRYEKKQTLTLEELKEVFGQHWKDENWHEVLRLIAGMVEETKAEELILYLMQIDGRKEKYVNLMLAAGCLSEVRNWKSIEKTSEALWKRFVEEVVRYDPPYYYEPWRKEREVGPTRRAAVERIATTWSGQKVRKWLWYTARNDLDPIVREAAVRELARSWKEEPETLPWLKDRARSDEDGSVRQAAVQELARGWKEDPQTPPLLKERARSDEHWSVRQAAVQELARGWKEDPQTPAWLKACARSDKHSSVRQAAVQELARGWREDPQTLPWLKACARSDKHRRMRQAAMQELARGWKEDPETLPLLKNRARSDEHADVRLAALQELARGWKEDPETLPWLQNRARSDEHADVRLAALQELARGWKEDPETLPWLQDCARSNEDWRARLAALQELARGWKEDPETLPLLQDRARSDEDEDVRLAAVRELARGWKEDPETLPWLQDRARSDKHANIRQAAVQELARGWKEDPETLPSLQEHARSDKHPAVRQAAVQELARGWEENPETLSLLKDRARSDEHWSVRQTAVRELARGWKKDPETLALLKDRARSDKDELVRQVAAKELKHGWGISVEGSDSEKAHG